LTRIFYGFVVAGMALVVLLAGVFPLPSSPRFRSTIAVIPDGGREESFTILWPQDRVQPMRGAEHGLLRAAGPAVVMGEGGAVAEVFRLRDAAGNVIGLASRSTSRRADANGARRQGSDWTLLLPSRGTLFMTQVNARDVGLQAGPDGTPGPATQAMGFWARDTRVRVTAGPADDGAGRIVGGTEEFAGLVGTYEETWELEEVAADGAMRGRIGLVTRVVQAGDAP